MVKQPTQLLRVLVPQGLFFTGVVIFLLTSTVNAAPKDKERWNKKYGTEEYVFGTEPIPFLRDNLHLLPKGKVLDLAMGEGRNGSLPGHPGF